MEFLPRASRVVVSRAAVAVPGRPSDEALVNAILAFEGSAYTNYPEDRGGPTKWGITIPTWTSWTQRRVTAEDIKVITRAQAVAYYIARSIRPYDSVPDPLRAQIIDYAIHSGHQRAVKDAQSMAGATPDGSIGPLTLGAITALGVVRVNNLVVGARLRLFAGLVASDPQQQKFMKGWRTRALSFYVG